MKKTFPEIKEKIGLWHCKTFYVDYKKVNDIFQFSILKLIETPIFISSPFISILSDDIFKNVDKSIAPIIISFSSIMNTYGTIIQSCYLRCSDEIRCIILDKIRKKQYIHLWKNGGCNGYWFKKELMCRKTFDNFYFDGKRKNKMINIIRNFDKKEDTFKKCGISYKLTFLLEGAPGTGKTSFIKTIANETNRDIFIFNFSGIERIEEMLIKMNDDDNEKKTKAIIAIEDVHSISHEMYEQIYNLLDGIYDIHNCIIMLTSNVPFTELDKTLVRTGRVNYVIKFGYLTYEAKYSMFNNIVPNFIDVRDDFLSKIKDIDMIPTILEAYLLQYCYEENSSELMKNIPKLIESVQSSKIIFEDTLESKNILFI